MVGPPVGINTVISFDVETDGRIIGKHSMRQLGAVAFNMKGKELSHFIMNVDKVEGGVEDPDTMKWWSEQPQGAWERVIGNPQKPKTVMLKFSDWMAQFSKPVLFAAPVMFDGYWLRYYFEVYVGPSAWNLYHKALDGRSVTFGVTDRYTGDWVLWAESVTGRHFENPTPHYALTDARVQGQSLFSILKWRDEHVQYK